MPIPTIGTLTAAAVLAGAAALTAPAALPVAPTAYSVCDVQTSTTGGSSQLSDDQAAQLVDGLRVVLTGATLDAARDPQAAAVARGLRSAGLTPARSSTGWRQAAYDLADDLMRQASSGDSAAGDVGATLARDGFSPTPADLLDDDQAAKDHSDGPNGGARPSSPDSPNGAQASGDTSTSPAAGTSTGEDDAGRGERRGGALATAIQQQDAHDGGVTVCGQNASEGTTSPATDWRSATSALIDQLRTADDPDASRLADQLDRGDADNHVNRTTTTRGNVGAEASQQQSGDQQSGDQQSGDQQSGDQQQSGDSATRGEDDAGGDWQQQARDLLTKLRAATDDPDAQALAAKLATLDAPGASGADQQPSDQQPSDQQGGDQQGGSAAEPAKNAGTGGPWAQLAQCESGGNWATNTGNGYYGGLQFDAATWKAYGGDAYAPSADKATEAQQIAVAEKVHADRGDYGAWPACSKKLGL